MKSLSLPASIYLISRNQKNCKTWSNNNSITLKLKSPGCAYCNVTLSNSLVSINLLYLEHWNGETKKILWIWARKQWLFCQCCFKMLWNLLKWILLQWGKWWQFSDDLQFSCLKTSCWLTNNAKLICLQEHQVSFPKSSGYWRLV